MGVFNEMRALGLVDNYSLYQGRVKDYKGDLVERLMVDVECKGHTITLYSTCPFSQSEEELALALDQTFLHSVKLESETTSSALNTVSIFSREPQMAVKQKAYTADTNTIYTPEAIYYCTTGWENNEVLYDKVLALSAVSRSLGLNSISRKTLRELGAFKLIDFKLKDEEPNDITIPLYQKLLLLGASRVAELEYYRGRPEVVGHAYHGKSTVQLDGFIYEFELSHHHKSEEDMTEQEVIQNLILKGISALGDKLIELFPTCSPRKGENRYSVPNNTFLYRNVLFFTPYRFSNESICGKRVTELKYKAELHGLTEDMISELESMDFKKIV